MILVFQRLLPLLQFVPLSGATVLGIVYCTDSGENEWGAVLWY